MIEFDEKRYNACSCVPLAMKPLASSLDIRLSDEALYMQQLVFGIGTLFDDTLDMGTETEQQAVLSYWNGLTYGAPEPRPDGIVLPRLITDLNELHGHMTTGQASNFYNRGLEAVHLTRLYRTVSDPYMYHVMRANEARLTFEMVVSTIPAPEQEHPNFQRYVRLGGIVGKMAAAVDGVVDLRNDAKEGRTAVPPTVASHTTLSRLALHETIAGVHEIGWRTTARMFRQTMRYYHGTPKETT